MTTTEHLEKIKAKCNANLDIASCAGAAEAGWRSTIAAINLCIAPDSRYQEMYLIANEPMVSHIIAAWPEELL